MSLFLLLSILLGGLYPAIVTLLAQTFFPGPANGSIIKVDGKIAGSRLIGQNFSDPKYFWGRPSYTAGFPYNASSSGASNLNPANPALIEAVRKRAAFLREHDPGNALPIPVDLVTGSASGLDPHISPAAALYQVPRVARARGKSEGEVSELVKRFTEPRFLGVLGEERVNVLLLNLALDGKI